MIFTSQAIQAAMNNHKQHLEDVQLRAEGKVVGRDQPWEDIRPDVPGASPFSSFVDLPRIVIDPFDEKQLNPNSYNLRLHPEMKVYALSPTVQRFPGTKEQTSDWKTAVEQWDSERYCRYCREHGDNGNLIELAPWSGVLDLREAKPTYSITIPDTGVVLVPGRLYIARTAEYTEAHNCVPGIEGRSSFGRLGLNIHSTAGYGDIGFCGTWTLEITVAHPTRVYPNVEICQLQFTLPHGRIFKVYQGKYAGQIDATPSKIHVECGLSPEGASQ